MPELYENEEIKPIKDFPNYYITSFGRVWSDKTHRWLKPTINRPAHPRYYVSLGRGNKRYIHRLVAEAFLPMIEGCDEVDHIDTNGLNNHVDNLRWVTHDENMENELTAEHLKTNSGGKVEILDTQTNQTYLGYEEAAEAAGVCKVTVWKHLKNRVKNPRWIYLNDGKRTVEK